MRGFGYPRVQVEPRRGRRAGGFRLDASCLRAASRSLSTFGTSKISDGYCACNTACIKPGSDLRSSQRQIPTFQPVGVWRRYGVASGLTDLPEPHEPFCSGHWRWHLAVHHQPGSPRRAAIRQKAASGETTFHSVVVASDAVICTGSPVRRSSTLPGALGRPLRCIRGSGSVRVLSNRRRRLRAPCARGPERWCGSRSAWPA